MSNVLLQEVDYKIEETAFGTWKHYLSEAGQAYHEFTSHRRIVGLPLFHYTAGRNPETGRRKMAKGIVALGKIAFGVVSIGQCGIGIISIGQLSLGLLLGLGQLSTGVFALGQVGLGGILGVGQFATGIIAIGQTALGYCVLAQSGMGIHVWDARGADEAARQFFHSLVSWSRFFAGR